MADTENKTGDEGTTEDERYRVQSTEEAADRLDREAAASEPDLPPADREDFLSAKDARATGEHYRMTPEEENSRKRRSIAIALGIVAFVALIYLITMLRLAENVGG